MSRIRGLTLFKTFFDMEDDIKVYQALNPYDMMELLLKRPEMYLSARTMSALQDFLTGYENGNPYPTQEPPFWNFYVYLIGEVRSKLNKDISGKNMARALLEECEGDERLAFDRFFEDLFEFGVLLLNCPL